MKRGLRSAAAVFGSLVVHATIAAFAMLHRNADARAEAAHAYRDVWSAQSVEVGTVPERASTATAPAPSPLPAAAAALAAPPPAAVEPPRAVARDAPPAEPSGIDPSATAAKQRHAKVTPLRRRDPGARVAVPSSPTARAAPSASSAVSEAEAGGSLGGLGLPVGVRHLARAFVRALSMANQGDSAWSELPLGVVGQATVSIEVDTEGHVAEVEIDPAQPAAPVLRRMIDRAALLLRSGTFSLDARKVSSGVERFVIGVTLTHVSADRERDDTKMYSVGSEPPTQARPGYARFTLNSGRHVEATVRFATP